MKEIYTIRMARWLVKRGFNPVTVVESKKYNSKLVYIFEDSKELEDAIYEYLMTEALE